jgi:hypothetical protein
MFPSASAGNYRTVTNNEPDREATLCDERGIAQTDSRKDVPASHVIGEVLFCG